MYKRQYYSLSKFADSEELLDEGCDCPVCKAGWTRGQLRALMKSEKQEDKHTYYNLASMHNLRFIIRLTEQARQAILDGTYAEFKENFLKNYYHR